MTWNYRIIVYEGDGENYFQMHEVYYDEDGNPDGYTENPIHIGAKSIEELEWVFEKMKEALTKPILSTKDFPNEYQEIAKSNYLSKSGEVKEGINMGGKYYALKNDI